MASKRKAENTASIAIFSALPPPFGGITMHIHRLIDRLIEDEIPFTLYEQTGQSDPGRNVVPAERSTRGFIRFLIHVPEKFVHLHTNKLLPLMVAIFVLQIRRKGLILTFHGQSGMRRFRKFSRLQKWFVRLQLSKVEHFFAVNENLHDWLVSEVTIRPNRVSVVPAFLMPVERELDPKIFPPTVSKFSAGKEALVGSQGWYGPILAGGIHTYSFDFLLRLASKLKKEFPTVGLYTLISGTENIEFRDAFWAEYKERGLEKTWLVQEEPFYAAGLLKQSAAFLRPTFSDGDSVTVRECLSFGVPVIASDSVKRPADCVLFENRNYDELEEALLNVLKEPERFRFSPAPHQSDSYHEIQRVYQNCLAR